MCTSQQRSTVFLEDAEISVLCEAFIFNVQFPFPQQKYSVTECIILLAKTSIRLGDFSMNFCLMTFDSCV